MKNDIQNSIRKINEINNNINYKLTKKLLENNDLDTTKYCSFKINNNIISELVDFNISKYRINESDLYLIKYEDIKNCSFPIVNLEENIVLPKVSQEIRKHFINETKETKIFYISYLRENKVFYKKLSENKVPNISKVEKYKNFKLLGIGYCFESEWNNLDDYGFSDLLTEGPIWNKVKKLTSDTIDKFKNLATVTGKAIGVSAKKIGIPLAIATAGFLMVDGITAKNANAEINKGDCGVQNLQDGKPAVVCKLQDGRAVFSRVYDINTGNKRSNQEIQGDLDNAYRQVLAQDNQRFGNNPQYQQNQQQYQDPQLGNRYSSQNNVYDQMSRAAIELGRPSPQGAIGQIPSYRGQGYSGGQASEDASRFFNAFVNSTMR